MYVLFQYQRSPQGVDVSTLGLLFLIFPSLVSAPALSQNSCRYLSHISLGLILDAVNHRGAGCFPKSFLNKLTRWPDLFLSWLRLKSGGGKARRGIGGLDQ